MNTPISQIYKTSFFETRLTFRRFWVKEPRHSENGLVEICHLYRKTPLRSSIPQPKTDFSQTPILCRLLLFPLPSHNVQHDLQHWSLITFLKEEKTSETKGNPCAKSTSPFCANIPIDNFMAQVYQNVIFRNEIGIPTILGKGTPWFQTMF